MKRSSENGDFRFSDDLFDWREPRQIKQIRLIHLFFDMTPTIIPCTDRDRHLKIAFLFSFTLFRGRSPHYKLHKTASRSVGFACELFWRQGHLKSLRYRHSRAGGNPGFCILGNFKAAAASTFRTPDNAGMMPQ